MSGQHYCLRWNNYQSNMTSVFHQLLQNEAFVDVTLACNDLSLKAHKVSTYQKFILRNCTTLVICGEARGVEIQYTPLGLMNSGVTSRSHTKIKAQHNSTK
jgi:hypothetical protein